MSDNGYRCGHAPCECTALQGSSYCSDTCEAAALGGHGSSCECGHEVCEHRQARGRQASDPDYVGPT